MGLMGAMLVFVAIYAFNHTPKLWRSGQRTEAIAAGLLGIAVVLILGFMLFYPVFRSRF
jgi:hypothetical protein